MENNKNSDKNFIRQIAAGIIVFRRTIEGPKFLLLYHRGKYWNFPKGKIEVEEKSFQAAIRETREETGLNRNDLIIANNFKAYEKFTFWNNMTPKSPSRSENNRQKILKIIIFYLAETKRHQIKISDEHNGYGWFDHKEAAHMLKKYKDSLRVLNQANDFIKKIK